MEANWVKYLPGFIRAKLDNRPELQSVLANSSWLFADKILRLGVGLLISVWIARYLGPEQFGLMNYAVAIVALFAGISTSGLDGVVVRELVKKKYPSDVLLGSACLLQLCGGFISFIIAVILVKMVRPNDILVQAMVALLAAAFFFKPVEIIRYWFESKLESRCTVFVENAVFVFFAAIKLLLIAKQAAILYFVAALLGESVLVAGGFLWIYRNRGGNFSKWTVNFSCVNFLLKSAWPLALSSSFVLINMNLDKILLGELATEHDVGLYSVALSLVGALYFLPVIIGASIVPGLTKLYASDKLGYKKQVNTIYRYSFFVTVAIAVLMSVFSSSIIQIMYGDRYSGANHVLAISAISIVFVSQISLRGRLLIIEGNEKYLALFVFLGAVLNAIINFITIPLYGAVGAALAYTTSWAASALVFPFFFKTTRLHGLLMYGSKV